MLAFLARAQGSCPAYRASLVPQGTHPEPENYLLTREGIAENLGPLVSRPNVVINL